MLQCCEQEFRELVNHTLDSPMLDLWMTSSSLNAFPMDSWYYQYKDEIGYFPDNNESSSFNTGCYWFNDINVYSSERAVWVSFFFSIPKSCFFFFFFNWNLFMVAIWLFPSNILFLVQVRFTQQLVSFMLYPTWLMGKFSNQFGCFPTFLGKLTWNSFWTHDMIHYCWISLCSDKDSISFKQ